VLMSRKRAKCPCKLLLEDDLVSAGVKDIDIITLPHSTVKHDE
jgi:hypothetical protein